MCPKFLQLLSYCFITYSTRTFYLYCIIMVLYFDYFEKVVVLVYSLVQLLLKSLNTPADLQGRRNEKRARGADFVEGHRQNSNYVKIHTLEFRGSVAFFLRQILTNYILCMASAITLDINTSQISSIDSAQRVLLSLTKSTSKAVYIIFFILKEHFCPPCPSQQKARGAAAPPAPPVPASLLISLVNYTNPFP